MAVDLDNASTGNLYVGKGICSFKKSGNDEFRDLGEVPECELTLNIETLEHFTSRSGIRSKDLIVVLERSGTIRFVMQEWTPENLALFFMGSVDLDDPNGPTVDILDVDAITGEFQFHGTNQVGPRYDVFVHNMRITPSASLNLIQENDFGGVEVTGEMLLSSTTGKFGTVTLTNLNTAT